MNTKGFQRPLGPRLPAPKPGGPRGPPLTLPSLNAPLPSPTPTPPPQSTGKAGLRPKLGLAISKEIKFDVYAGGPGGEAATYLSPGSGDERTIVPDGTTHSNGATIVARDAAIKQPIDQISDRIKTISISKSAGEGPQILTTSSDWSDADFEEIASLGEGAGGAVHKVKHKPSNMVVARKTITTREAPMKQLLRELNIMSSTTHPNIVSFYGVYMSPSSSEVKILMELCEGGSLESVAKKIRERGAIVGEKIAGRIAEGVLQGLAYLHSRKTIHRDIKPSNILLTREGVVRLVDFGVSGELDALSLAGTFTGTSFYMAPERIQGKDYSIRSDVWSTGITLLELVQNRFPFPPDLPPIELMMYITNQEPPRLEDQEGVVSWSEEMKDFVKQALTVDQSQRPTPAAMLDHPWIHNMMKYENTMGRWIATVWGWTKKKSRDE
ncbi:STE/STE7 protein kinase [Coprinopsis sp. MPI-PUGE-AT-0042]|nr:STE/STE7 protein kinase [Coprinopsis sp. MPI-PUGE-AT-0042]